MIVIVSEVLTAWLQLGWRNRSGALIETWTNGWSTTFWQVRVKLCDCLIRKELLSDDGVQVDGIEPGAAAGQARLVLGRGGQQTGRG